MGFIFNHFRDQGFTFSVDIILGFFNLITITCHHSFGKFQFAYLYMDDISNTLNSSRQGCIILMVCR